MEELYYKCLDRIDSNPKVAEMFLVGCVHELTIRYDHKVPRDTVRDNFEYMNIERYERYLNLINDMSDDSLAALIASSIDLTIIHKQVSIICAKIDVSNYDEVTANCHANKAKKIGDIMGKIASKMKIATRKKCGGLF